MQLKFSYLVPDTGKLQGAIDFLQPQYPAVKGFCPGEIADIDGHMQGGRE